MSFIEIYHWMQCIKHRFSFPISSVLCCAQPLSCVQSFVTPWTVACRVPLSMEFPRQEYQSGLLFSSPGTTNFLIDYKSGSGYSIVTDSAIHFKHIFIHIVFHKQKFEKFNILRLYCFSFIFLYTIWLQVSISLL